MTLSMPAALLAGAAALLSASLSTGTAPIDLPGDHLHPESVSITPEGTAYVGSMYGGVLRVSLRSGKSEQWIAPGAYGSGALFGVLADQRHGLVWTCTNEFPGSGLAVAGADPGHWLKAFDIKTGQGKVSLRLPGEKPVCNDMAVGRDGSLYVTDTAQPRILRWRPGATALEIWAENPVFGPEPTHGGLDGIAVGGDGQVYVNNVRSGAFYRVAVKPDGSAGAVTTLTLSRPLSKPDGMRPISGLDFLVAEGSGSIAKLSVKGDNVTVTTLAEGIHLPTGVDVSHGPKGAMMGWYVQGQLAAIFSPDKGAAQLPFRLTPVPLSR